VFCADRFAAPSLTLVDPPPGWAERILRCNHESVPSQHPSPMVIDSPVATQRLMHGQFSAQLDPLSKSPSYPPISTPDAPYRQPATAISELASVTTSSPLRSVRPNVPYHERTPEEQEIVAAEQWARSDDRVTCSRLYLCGVKYCRINCYR